MHASLQADGPFVYREVADGVVVAIARPRANPDCNAVLVDLGDEILVVDAHARRSSAEAVAAFGRRRFAAPITMVVNTHHHWDHWQGNRAYVSLPGVRLLAHPAAIASIRDRAARSIRDRQALVGHQRVVADLADSQDLASFAAELDDLAQLVRGAGTDPAAGRAAGFPDVPVQDELRIGGSRRQVRIFHPGHAHSPGDLLVEIPDARSVVTGDCVVGWTPFLGDADAVGWIRTLDRIGDGAATTLLMGHGEPAGRDWLRVFRSYLADLVTTTEDGYAEGLRGHDLVATVRDALRSTHEAPLDVGAAPGRRWSARMAGNVEHVEALIEAGRLAGWHDRGATVVPGDQSGGRGP